MRDDPRHRFNALGGQRRNRNVLLTSAGLGRCFGSRLRGRWTKDGFDFVDVGNGKVEFEVGFEDLLLLFCTILRDVHGLIERGGLPHRYGRIASQSVCCR